MTGRDPFERVMDKGEGKKRCSTPSCTLPEYHIGNCGSSFQLAKRPRLSLPPPPSPPPTQERRRVSETDYDSNLTKASHRFYLFACSASDSRPLLYLDGPESGCTRFLLDQGVDPSRLSPCNMDASVVLSTLQKTSVHGIASDVQEVARRSKVGEYSAAWFDMTGTTLDIYGVVHASSHTMVTLNCRGEFVQSKERELYFSCKSIPGVRVENYGVYRGGGGKLNMVYAFLTYSLPHRPPPTPPSSLSHLDWLGVPLMVPTSRWKKSGVSVKGYVLDGGCIPATVTDVVGDCLVLSYMTDSGVMLPDKRSVEDKVGRVTPSLAREWRIGNKGP